jgi:hypothetical protein
LWDLVEGENDKKEAERERIKNVSLLGSRQKNEMDCDYIDSSQRYLCFL